MIKIVQVKRNDFKYFFYSKHPKNEGLVSSIGTGYRDKSSVPSALNPSPQILGANVINDTSEDAKKKHRSRNKNVSNPVFGKDDGSLYNAEGKNLNEIVILIDFNSIQVFYFYYRCIIDASYTGI